jgi:hypothetical protein
MIVSDINNDGIDDLVTGAPAYNTNQGRAYVFYGGSMTSENASGADIVLTGEAITHQFGEAVSSGDLNSDGVNDVVVGAESIGRVYVFYGGSLVSVNASVADVIITADLANYFGNLSVSSADTNTDGTDDLIIGAPGYFSNQGRVYVFYGDSLVSENTSDADITITGENTSDFFGESLSTGDLNSDGTTDLIVGATGYNSSQGRTYVFYGGELRTESASDASLIIDGETTSSDTGVSLLATDINDNGVDDLIIGANAYDDPNDQGRVYVLMSEAAITTPATFKLRGDMKIEGTVKFGN